MKNETAAGSGRLRTADLWFRLSEPDLVGHPRLRCARRHRLCAREGQGLQRCQRQCLLLVLCRGVLDSALSADLRSAAAMNVRAPALFVAPWAGLATGPACWALNTQLNYALVPWFCGRGLNVVPVIAAVLVVVSLAGAVWSWLAWSRYEGPGLQVPEQDGRPGYLLSGIGVA